MGRRFDLDLISFLKAIRDARMCRGVLIPAWYLLLVAVLGSLRQCESLRDLEGFARRHHAQPAQAVAGIAGNGLRSWSGSLRL